MCPRICVWCRTIDADAQRHKTRMPRASSWKDKKTKSGQKLCCAHPPNIVTYSRLYARRRRRRLPQLLASSGLLSSRAQWILAIKSSALVAPLIGRRKLVYTRLCQPSPKKLGASGCATINESNVLFNLFHYKLYILYNTVVGWIYLCRVVWALSLFVCVCVFVFLLLKDAFWPEANCSRERCEHIGFYIWHRACSLLWTFATAAATNVCSYACSLIGRMHHENFPARHTLQRVQRVSICRAKLGAHLYS